MRDELPFFPFASREMLCFSWWRVKGVVHFKKKTFADNLLTPMSSKMSMSFSRKEIKIFDENIPGFFSI